MLQSNYPLIKRQIMIIDHPVMKLACYCLTDFELLATKTHSLSSSEVHVYSDCSVAITKSTNQEAA